MKKTHSIFNHPLFVQSMRKNELSEINRPYCKHDLAHAIDVARIAYVINLEDQLGFSKETIYATALLHDITKWEQHLSDIPHNQSAIEPATKILQDVEFSEEEIANICYAILHHKDGPPDTTGFAYLIFRADKLSRACYSCDSKSSCYWEDSKKNTLLKY